LKAFRLFTKSTNTNSFGLRDCILVAKDGEAWGVACADNFCSPVYGKDYNCPEPSGELLPPGQNYTFADYASGMGWELPHLLDKAPQEAVDAAWSGLGRSDKK
jgi:hypothetical protein